MFLLRNMNNLQNAMICLSVHCHQYEQNQKTKETFIPVLQIKRGNADNLVIIFLIFP